jgi:hypothetical protein
MKAQISPLVMKILYSEDENAINALLRTRLSREGEEIEFEGKRYVVSNGTYYGSKLRERLSLSQE